MKKSGDELVQDGPKKKRVTIDEGKNTYRPASPDPDGERAEYVKGEEVDVTANRFFAKNEGYVAPAEDGLRKDKKRVIEDANQEYGIGNSANVAKKAKSIVNSALDASGTSGTVPKLNMSNNPLYLRRKKLQEAQSAKK